MEIVQGYLVSSCFVCSSASLQCLGKVLGPVVLLLLHRLCGHNCLGLHSNCEQLRQRSYIIATFGWFCNQGGNPIFSFTWIIRKSLIFLQISILISSEAISQRDRGCAKRPITSKPVQIFWDASSFSFTSVCDSQLCHYYTDVVTQSGCMSWHEITGVDMSHQQMIQTWQQPGTGGDDE